MRLDPSGYRLPPELLEHFEYMRNHKPQLLDAPPVPMLPVVIRGDFYDLVYTPGPVMTRKVLPGTGNLLGVA